MAHSNNPHGTTFVTPHRHVIPHTHSARSEAVFQKREQVRTAKEHRSHCATFVVPHHNHYIPHALYVQDELRSPFASASPYNTMPLIVNKDEKSTPQRERDIRRGPKAPTVAAARQRQEAS